MFRPARRFAFPLATILGAITIAACATTGPSALDTAREGTAAEWNCPDDQITVVYRPDMRPLPTPPSDMASDPQRLALWKEQTAADPASLQHPKIVQVAGCGHQQFYRCFHWDSGDRWMGRRNGGWTGTTTTSCTYIAPPGMGAVGTASAAVSVDRIGMTRTAKPLECPLQLVPKGAPVPPYDGLAARVFVVAAPGTDPVSDGVRQLVHPQACALGGDVIMSMGGVALTNTDGVPYESIEFDVYASLPQSF